MSPRTMTCGQRCAPRLTAADDLGVVDAMYREHQTISEHLEAVDDSLGSDRATAAAEQISCVVLEHLDHEERAVLPLVVRTFSTGSGTSSSTSSASKRRGREGAVFVMWVLTAPRRRMPKRCCVSCQRAVVSSTATCSADCTSDADCGVARGRSGRTSRRWRRNWRTRCWPVWYAAERGPRFISLLTVRGRVTGEPLTTPIVPFDHDGQRWIVAPFGEVSWVRNARAAGRVELGRGDDAHSYAIDELDPGKAAPVLREYLSMPTARYVQEYFEITPTSTDEAIAAQAPRHPVFALRN